MHESALLPVARRGWVFPPDAPINVGGICITTTISLTAWHLGDCFGRGHINWCYGATIIAVDGMARAARLYEGG